MSPDAGGKLIHDIKDSSKKFERMGEHDVSIKRNQYEGI